MLDSTRPPANLVFLVDVSGSMNSANKLGLLKNALKMLSRQLTAKDSVAIVVYAGARARYLNQPKEITMQVLPKQVQAQHCDYYWAHADSLRA